MVKEKDNKMSQGPLLNNMELPVTAKSSLSIKW